MKILLLEDDIALNKAIRKVLELDRHEVAVFTDGKAVLEALPGSYGLYILDINVPHITGLQLLGKIMETKSDAQVMIISSNTDLESIENAYGIGCVDYLKKPFHITELRAKINRIKPPKTDLLSKVKLHSQEEVLTKKEKKLLTLLLEHMGETVTYKMIASEIYDNKEMSMEALRTLMRRLRAKLESDIIRNVIDEGYSIPSLDPASTQERRSDISALLYENRQLRREREILRKKAFTDPLTGLYNRARMEEVFLFEHQKFLQYNTPFSIALIDLDDFKDVNDTFGHTVGDRYLKMISKHMMAFFKQQGIIGRWGGEEFLIMLPGLSLNEAKALVERFQTSFRDIDCPTIGERTASFGLASIDTDDTLSSLVSRADEALLLAKLKGKNRIEVNDRSMHISA